MLLLLWDPLRGGGGAGIRSGSWRILRGGRRAARGGGCRRILGRCSARIYVHWLMKVVGLLRLGRTLRHGGSATVVEGVAGNHFPTVHMGRGTHRGLLRAGGGGTGASSMTSGHGRTLHAGMGIGGIGLRLVWSIHDLLIRIPM